MRPALVGSLCLLVASGAAGEEGELRDGRAGLVRHLEGSAQLLDDPAGARSRLERLGLRLRLFYNQFLGWNPRGGAGSGDRSGHSGSYDLFLQADAEELLGWRGFSSLLHVKGQYDRNINRRVRALSAPIDDADFDEPIYVDELWAQQELFAGRMLLRAGFLEQQVVFDRNAYANSEDRQFMTTFLDNNALVPLPNGLGAALIVRPIDDLELAAGLADADNTPRQVGLDTAFDDLDGLTAYLELTWTVRLPSARGPLPGHYRLGIFRDGRKRPRWGTLDPGTGLPRTDRGRPGGYASFDQLVLREAAEGEQGLGLFARFGGADEDVSLVAWFWSVGLQYAGPVPGRDWDVLGLGAYQSIASDRFRRAVAPAADRETGIELYYRIDVLPWLAVTPDFQYVIDPGAMRGASDAVVGVLRFRVSF